MYEVALRSTAILIFAWAVTQTLRRATAATRHLVWHSAIVAILAAPLLSPVAPKFNMPGIPGISNLPLVLQGRMSVDPGSAGSISPAPTPATFRSPGTVSTFGTSGTFGTPGTLGTRRTLGTFGTLGTLGTFGTFGTLGTFGTFGTLGTLGTLVWSAGSLLLSLWFALAWVSSGFLARDARPAPAAWQLEVDALRERLRITRRVRLRLVDVHTSPLAVGLWRSTLLVPATAAAWPAERRRAVLLHELAHIRRGDCAVQALAHAACALYWFNPLVWMAAARLRSERERACDDEVLRSGTQASAYAAHLLDIARGLRPALRPSAALAMARPSELEGRLLAVLAHGRARVPARGSRWAIATTLALATVAALGATPVARSTPAATAPARAADFRWSYEAFTEPRVRADRDAIQPLQAALDDGDQDVREKAALGLALMSGAEVIPPLLKALADADAQVREKAAIGLALRRDPRVVDALLTAMTDPDAQVREKVAMALGTSGDVRAVAVLEHALQDPDAQVREKAVTGLTLLRARQ
jgi:beta-lactamase regulating signal transducer with metallopeptidase domain